MNRDSEEAFLRTADSVRRALNAACDVLKNDGLTPDSQLDLAAALFVMLMKGASRPRTAKEIFLKIRPGITIYSKILYLKNGPAR